MDNLGDPALLNNWPAIRKEIGEAFERVSGRSIGDVDVIVVPQNQLRCPQRPEGMAMGEVLDGRTVAIATATGTDELSQCIFYSTFFHELGHLTSPNRSPFKRYMLDLVGKGFEQKCGDVFRLVELQDHDVANALAIITYLGDMMEEAKAVAFGLALVEQGKTPFLRSLYAYDCCLNEADLWGEVCTLDTRGSPLLWAVLDAEGYRTGATYQRLKDMPAEGLFPDIEKRLDVLREPAPKALYMARCLKGRDAPVFEGMMAELKTEVLKRYDEKTYSGLRRDFYQKLHYYMGYIRKAPYHFEPLFCGIAQICELEKLAGTV